MSENHEGKKRTTRKGIPHHQDELPFDIAKREKPSVEKQTDFNESEITPDDASPPKDSKSLRDEKGRSVIRNRFIADDYGDTGDSMVGRVVDNLLNRNDKDGMNLTNKSDEEELIADEISEEIISEDNLPVESIDEYENKNEGQNEERESVTLRDESEDNDEFTDKESNQDEEQEEADEYEEEADEKDAEQNSESAFEHITRQVESSEPSLKEYETKPDRGRLAKQYEKIHNILFAVDILITVLAILAFLFFGGSRNLRDWAQKFTTNPWIVPLLYSAVVTIVYYFVILIPLHAIDFNFENKFKLNTQSFASWLDDNFKSLVLNLIFMALFLEVTYFLLRKTPDYWWIWAAGAWTLFSVVIANLFPIIILPLFYKLTPLKNESLRNRLIGLADRVRMKILNVYEIKMSQKTKKANALLAGLGNTKRIILGDTLINHYSGDEIETIIAHELGHHYHMHIIKMIVLGILLSFAGFFVTHLFIQTSIDWFEYLDIKGIDDIAGFPFLLIAIFLFIILTSPISNSVSRRFEKQADRFALRLTDRPNEFVTAMKKLADQNLSDKEPSAIVEFLLHSHPSISSRIAAAEDYAVRKRI